jgi:hypothetical protein
LGDISQADRVSGQRVEPVDGIATAVNVGEERIRASRSVGVAIVLLCRAV